MPPKTPEDIIQSVYDATLKAIRTSGGSSQSEIISYLAGGEREHREQLSVKTTYIPASNSISFSTPKRHIYIYCKEAVYWVDSATNDADAQSKLTTPNQRGFINVNSTIKFTFVNGITRLDFLGVLAAGPVYVTGLA